MITGLNHLTLAVSDLARSSAFYTDVLGLRLLARWPSGAYLLAGELWLALIQDKSCRSGPLPEYTHIALQLPADQFGPARARLDAAGVVLWKENRSEGDSIYLLDPDGHKLELHASGWRERLAHARQQPWEGLEILIDPEEFVP
ncbi:MAG: VOC family protein [Candidatus Sericytochromatia bacterium]